MTQTVDENPSGDNAEELIETPEVELDQFIDVEGELIENLLPEEVSEDEVAEEVADSEDEPTAETPTPAPEVNPQVPAPEPTAPVAPALQDPGDFTPKSDYSFDVVTTEGKTIKVSTPEEARSLAERLDSEEGLLSASQFAEFVANQAVMRQGIATERREFEADKAKFDDQKAAEQAQTAQIDQWTKEVTYLRAKNLIPTPSKEADANWTAHADVEGVKEAMDIFKWMDTENKARREAGIAEVSSAVDAFRMMQAEQAEQVVSDTKQREGDARRARGSKIGGPSSHIPSGSANGSAIVGSGGSLNDLIYEAQMLQS